MLLFLLSIAWFFLKTFFSNIISHLYIFIYSTKTDKTKQYTRMFSVFYLLIWQNKKLLAPKKSINLISPHYLTFGWSLQSLSQSFYWTLCDRLLNRYVILCVRFFSLYKSVFFVKKFYVSMISRDDLRAENRNNKNDFTVWIFIHRINRIPMLRAALRRSASVLL